jgi:hypothetical protein
MGLSTVRILLGSSKTYPSHYFKILKKIRIVPSTRENLRKIFIQIKWKFDYFFALRKQRFPIRFSRVSGYFWCLLYMIMVKGWLIQKKTVVLLHRINLRLIRQLNPTTKKIKILHATLTVNWPRWEIYYLCVYCVSKNKKLCLLCF